MTGGAAISKISVQRDNQEYLEASQNLGLIAINRLKLEEDPSLEHMEGSPGELIVGLWDKLLEDFRPERQ